MPDAGRWYLTSPLPPSGSTTSASYERSPSNSRRIDSYERPTVCSQGVQATAVGHPETTWCAPPSAPSSIASSSIGMRTSSPSSENCFWPRNDRRRYCSKTSNLGQAPQQAYPPLRLERDVEAAGLDRLAQPDALGVIRDVLDLVGARSHVHLTQPRERLEQRVAGDVEAQQARRDPRLELGRQRGDEPGLVERGVAHRLRAERIESRSEVAVHAIRLDERHRRRRRRRGGSGRQAPRPARRPAPERSRQAAARRCPECVRRRWPPRVPARTPRRSGATPRERSRARRGSPRGAAPRRQHSGRSRRSAPCLVVL
jgi:hypothetical protein